MSDKPPLTGRRGLRTGLCAEAIRRRALILTINSYVWTLPIKQADKLDFAHSLELTETSVLVEIHSDIGGIIERVLRAMPRTDPSPKVEPKP
jgi:hypothetical protein